MKHPFLLGLILMLAAPMAAAGDAWRLIKKEEGVETFVNTLTEDGFREYKGVARLEVTFDEATSTIRDIPGSIHWLPRCRRSEEVRRISETEELVYVVSRAPWPIKDRDIVWKRHYAVETDSQFLLEFTASDEPFAGEEETVRLMNARGVWEVRRLGPELIEVSFQFVGDSGGNVPKSFVNANNKSLPKNVLVALESRIHELRATNGQPTSPSQ